MQLSTRRANATSHNECDESGDGNTVAEPSDVDPIILYAPSKTEQPPPVGPVPCTCGVFLSGQFTKNSQEPPKGHPALLHEHPDPFPCNIWGNKQCTNRCLDIIVKHLPNSPTILCGSIDRDCHRERAYLFIKNCNNTWINTNLSAGREYCCKDGAPIKCPILGPTYTHPIWEYARAGNAESAQVLGISDPVRARYDFSMGPDKGAFPRHTPVCNVNTTTQTELEYEKQVLQVESTQNVSTLFSSDNTSRPVLPSTTQVSASHQHRYEDSKNISVRIDLDKKDKLSQSDEQCATDKRSQSPYIEKCSLVANRDIQDITLSNLTKTHNTAVLRCVQCGFGFSDSSILAMHQQLVHPRDGNKMQSEDAIHGDRTRQFPCHLCPKGFKMRGSLMVHMRVAHGGVTLGKAIAKIQESEVLTEERKFVCTTCNKAFKKLTNALVVLSSTAEDGEIEEQHLSQHLRTHDGKQWACEVCNKLFTTKYFLKKHKRLHTGEMPYTCSTCQKTFTFQQSYHKHLLYHSDDKPHVCTECDRAFKELSTLHNHQRIHTGEKPFTCETCGMWNFSGRYACWNVRICQLICSQECENLLADTLTGMWEFAGRYAHRHVGICWLIPSQECGNLLANMLTGMWEFAGRYAHRNVGICGTICSQVSQRTHKCPSQPPGTVVRQSGDLLQKLLNYKTQAGLEELRAQKEWIAEPSASKFTILMEAEIQNTPPGPKSFPVSHTQAIKPPEMAPISHEQSLYHVSPLSDHSILTIVSGDGPPREGEEGPLGETETAETETRTLSETTDFFNLVMSPPLQSIPSPSERLKHLSLSTDERIYQYVFDSNDGHNVPCQGEASTPNTQEQLQTINEESLKQLLLFGSLT
uniref:C2H2-type domain-containing protein n=1 Tax=Timema shepardi TaxID=629360 RepID=A0A7R9AUY3_TIMSH|nr:unnamed protein product [Timema shepardi]